MTSTKKQTLIKLPKASGVPNSCYPVIHYQNVLPDPEDHDAIRAMLQGNGFSVYGYFGHLGLRHYHPNVHECYCIVQGSTTFVLGRGPGDGEDVGQKINVVAGDVLILPAGTGHYTHESTDLNYISAYPADAPHWKVSLGTEPEEEVAKLAIVAAEVPIPTSDPIFGKGGPLLRRWTVAPLPSPE